MKQNFVKKSKQGVSVRASPAATSLTRWIISLLVVNKVYSSLNVMNEVLYTHSPIACPKRTPDSIPRLLLLRSKNFKVRDSCKIEGDRVKVCNMGTRKRHTSLYNEK